MNTIAQIKDIELEKNVSVQATVLKATRRDDRQQLILADKTSFVKVIVISPKAPILEEEDGVRRMDTGPR